MQFVSVLVNVLYKHLKIDSENVSCVDLSTMNYYPSVCYSVLLLLVIMPGFRASNTERRSGKLNRSPRLLANKHRPIGAASSKFKGFSRARTRNNHKHKTTNLSHHLYTFISNARRRTRTESEKKRRRFRSRARQLKSESDKKAIAE